MTTNDLLRTGPGSTLGPCHPLAGLSRKMPLMEVAMAGRALAFLAAVVFALAGASAHAAWVEKIIKVPVKVTYAYG